jgi:hypothetical protein
MAVGYENLRDHEASFKHNLAKITRSLKILTEMAVDRFEAGM